MAQRGSIVGNFAACAGHRSAKNARASWPGVSEFIGDICVWPWARGRLRARLRGKWQKSQAGPRNIERPEIGASGAGFGVFRPKRHAGRRRRNRDRNSLQTHRFSGPVAGAQFLGDSVWKTGENREEIPEISIAQKSAQRERVSPFFRPNRDSGRRRPSSGRNPLQTHRFTRMRAGAQFLGDLAWKTGENRDEIPEISSAPKSAQRGRVLLFFRPNPDSGRRRPSRGRNPLQTHRFSGLFGGAQFLGDLAWETGGKRGGTSRRLDRPEIGAAGAGFAVFPPNA